MAVVYTRRTRLTSLHPSSDVAASVDVAHGVAIYPGAQPPNDRYLLGQLSLPALLGPVTSAGCHTSASLRAARQIRVPPWRRGDEPSRHVYPIRSRALCTGT